MTEWIPAGLTPGTVGERVFASSTQAEARETIGAAAADDVRLDGALQADAGLTDLADPSAALAALGGVQAVGLFTGLGEVVAPEGADVILTSGHGRAGEGAARYVADPDQASPTASAWRAQSANGRWFVLDEAEPTFEQFGARGQADPWTPSVDDTAAIVDGAVAWSNLTGRPVRASGRIYNVRATLELTYGRLKGVGSTNSGNATTATSLILFSHLGDAPGIRTVLGANRKLAVIEGFDLRAASWDPTTGCAGYGLDIGSRVIARDLSVQHWGKSALFLHGDGTFGGAPSGGPYFSRFESCRFLFSKEHGAVVGTGANAVTFVDCEWKWNGAPSYGAVPTAAGNWDGLFVSHTGDGNPGDTYAGHWTQALSLIGGDASYNSRYGFHFLGMRDCPAVMPAYAELNKAIDGQVCVGLNVAHCHIVFGALSGGPASAKINGVYGEYAPTNQIYVGGKFLGGGGVYSPTGWQFGDAGLVYANSATGDQVRSVGSTSANGRHKVRLDGPNAEWNVGYNLGAADEITVSTADGVRLPARGRAVKFLQYVPVANRAAVIAGTYTGDATAWLQAALNTGKDVDLEGVTIYAAGLTLSGNQRCLFSSSGPANVFKNANGPILTVNGTDTTLRNIVFRGQSATYSGHNLVTTAARPRLEMCGSLDAAGRAVLAQSDKVQILGYTFGFSSADVGASGYDIEIGKVGVATLYHQIWGIYTGRQAGGILLVDTGSHTIDGGSQFGKLTIQKTAELAGANGGMTANSRILGNVSIGQSNAVFSGNQFSTSPITFAAGTSACSIDASNLLSGTPVVNNGNGNNYVARNISAASFPILKIGGHADAVELAFRQQEGLAVVNGGLVVANARSLKGRNSANTVDLSLIGTNSADNVFVGHGAGTQWTMLQSGAGGIYYAPSGVSAAWMDAGVFRPVFDNAMDIGSTALRWQDGFSWTWDAKSEYRVNGIKVIGPRESGWTSATGTSEKGPWNADAAVGLTFSSGPTQAECEALRDACAAAHRRVKAVEDLLRNHGLMN